jgi:AraC-like DNA-binding protein
MFKVGLDDPGPVVEDGLLMVKNGHTRVPTVDYAPPAGAPTAVEVVRLSTLRGRTSRLRSFSLPSRITFHRILTLSRGAITHTVDFERVELRPGSWLWIRPGQVQQWGELGGAEGTVVYFESAFLDTDTARVAGLHDSYAPSVIDPDNASGSSLRTLVDQLIEEFDSLGQIPLEVHTAVLRHLLATLVLRLSCASEKPAGARTHPLPDVFARFRALVERDFARSRDVSEYAAQLGYSPRTVSRATHDAFGVPAKQFIDQRVMLEAKRLLAHDELSAAQIATFLGFPSATSFAKFFRRHTGNTPGAFREAFMTVH